jgi:lipopolysaccharide export system protein LptA
MRNYIFLFILLIHTMSVYALSDDRLKNVHIVADSGVYNYKTGINVYEGHVKIDQGTTHVTADRITTKNNAKHQIQEAIAYGIEHLAHYWTLPNPDEAVMHAYAKVIKFYPLESNVTLEKNVFVSQGKNNFRGQLVHYNSANQTITLPPEQNGHAVIVYNPDK